VTITGRGHTAVRQCGFDDSRASYSLVVPKLRLFTTVSTQRTTGESQSDGFYVPCTGTLVGCTGLADGSERAQTQRERAI
jgi:hypothetical protein